MKRYIGALALGALALLALACAPAQQPTAAPTAAAPAVAPPTATVPAGAAPLAIEIPTTGRYVDRAGLQIFIPEGFVFGGPIIPADPRPPRYGGTIVRFSLGDPPSVDPYHTATSQMILPMGVVYERLIMLPIGPGIDTTLDVRVPGLAESWEISDDLLKYTFHLRKGVKWHNLPPVNGRELDAEDVKATFELFTSAGSVQRGFFDAVDRVEVVDKYTAAYHMKRVGPEILSNLADMGRGFILPREMADPASHARRLTGIGTGAFMVAGPYQYKVGITLERNPDYWVTDERGNRLPYMDGYKMVIISDASAALAAFRTGKIDQPPGLSSTALRALVKSNPTTLIQERNASPYSVSFAPVGFRLDKAPWNDVRVRRAMSLAIDYEAVGQTIHEAPFIGNVWSPGAWYGQPSNSLEAITKECACPWYSYDPVRAKALLAEAGFPNGFTTTLEYHDYGSVAIREMFELFAGYWQEIGINVQLRFLDLTIFRANLVIGAWTDLGQKVYFPSPSSMYASLETLVPGRGANPLTGWVNDPKLTALVLEFEASYRDEAKLKDLIRQARAQWLDQVYDIPTAISRSYGAFSPRLRNFQPANSYLVGADHRVTAVAWIDDEWSFAK